jgi:hypothetical protein
MSRSAQVGRWFGDWKVLAGVAVAGLLTGTLLTGTLLKGGDLPSRAEEEQAVQARRVVVQQRRLLSLDGAAGQAKRGFSPEQALGPPDVRQAGDNPQAWASQTPDGQKEWLVCEYAEPIDARAVIVYESYNPGALFRVSAFSPDGDEVVAWEGADPTPRGKPKGISVIPMKLDFPVKKIRLAIDSPAVPGWNEIDAVGLEDRKGTTHWATQAQASSTFGAPGAFNSPVNSKRSYAPEQAAGEPDTPRPGDQGTAWASATPDGQPEWLVCGYEKRQLPLEIVVYENNAPGAITKIGVFQDDDTEVTLWEGTDPTPRDQPWGVSVFPVKVDFEFKKLKLYINSNAVPGYNEIDAVGLRAATGDTQWASEVEASSIYGVGMQRSDALMMDPRMNADKEFKNLQTELQALRGEVEELRKIRTELKELREFLKDGLK